MAAGIHRLKKNWGRFYMANVCMRQNLVLRIRAAASTSVLKRLCRQSFQIFWRDYAAGLHEARRNTMGLFDGVLIASDIDMTFLDLSIEDESRM